jgi:hypothetical protein
MERQQGKKYREKIKKLRGRGLLRGKEDDIEEIDEEEEKKAGKDEEEEDYELEYGKEEEDEQE